jgi:hypothetical protein
MQSSPVSHHFLRLRFNILLSALICLLIGIFLRNKRGNCNSLFPFIQLRPYPITERGGVHPIEWVND